MTVFVCATKRMSPATQFEREQRERESEQLTDCVCVCVCVCSLALSGVSFPGMNNLSECSSNHATLVILFSRACLQIPSLFPHRSTKTTSNSSSTYFSLLTVISAHYSPSKRGISDRAGTHIDP